MKEAYQSEVIKGLKPNQKSADDYMKDNLESMEKTYKKDDRENLLLHYKINYGDIIQNPQYHQYFVK